MLSGKAQFVNRFPVEKKAKYILIALVKLQNNVL